VSEDKYPDCDHDPYNIAVQSTKKWNNDLWNFVINDSNLFQC